MKYDISVIIPAYNCAETIGDCLRSVFMQKNADKYEVIVVDDGSTDQTVKVVCDAMKTYPGLRLIAHENMGVSVARNNGIDAAHGEYVTFVDADDMVGLDAQRMMGLINIQMSRHTVGNLVSKIGIFNRNRNTPVFEDLYFQRMLDAARTCDADVALGGKITLYKDRDISCIRMHSTFYIGGTVEDKATFLNQADARESANFALYRRDMLNKTGLRFEHKMTLNEDILFCMQAIVRANKIVTVPGVAYLYNRHADTLSNIQDPDIKFQKYRLAYIQEYSVLLTELRRHPKYAQLYTHWLKDFSELGQSVYEGNIKHDDTYLAAAFPSICYACGHKTCNKCPYQEIADNIIKQNIHNYLR